MTQENDGWEEYYRAIKGRPPRQLLLDALTYFEGDSPQSQRKAIDLGCGDGTESAVLLERGWHVLAIDGELASIEYLLAKVSKEQETRLQTQVSKFEDVVLSQADLVHASLSIPFCPPEHFDSFWVKIVNAIKPDGLFAGQFFGMRDTWADSPEMTFHTEEQVCRMFENFEVKYFHERDEDGNAVSGPKHWHVFTVIVRKK